MQKIGISKMPKERLKTIILDKLSEEMDEYDYVYQSNVVYELLSKDQDEIYRYYKNDEEFKADVDKMFNELEYDGYLEYSLDDEWKVLD